MEQLIEGISQHGRHCALYGERGVGKTSLAAVVSAVIPRRLTVRVNCGAGDSFSSVWRHVFREIALTTERPRAGFVGGSSTDHVSAEQLLPDGDVAPDQLRRALASIADGTQVTIFVDEFDRLDPAARAGFADVIKGLSDYNVPATIVIVGVADDVDELVAEHRSVERSLQEILMPRMSPAELEQIVRLGVISVGMTMEESALIRIVDLSKGLPHYTHLLAQEAAVSAAWDQRDEVVMADVDVAISNAIEKAQQTVRNDYSKATYSPRQGNLYPLVLRAAALVHKDELGFFAPADIRDPLTQLAGKRYDIPSYQQHLNAFTSEGRAQVLQRKGEPRRFRYRFRNPLLEPYIILRGLNEDAHKTAVGQGDG
jgi:Cdc6-like AAA superfamily ATPase